VAGAPTPGSCVVKGRLPGSAEMVGGEKGADTGVGMVVKFLAGVAAVGVEHGLFEGDGQHQPVELLRR
jgi:hypothetical protein